ncbi:MAG: Gfo/Idh/MocA family oxidoreductase [Planctomycetes bacterium]|nr:Gfo/Idh/MocA family oxidoreductase [Planctomycetota bacterium]
MKRIAVVGAGMMARVRTRALLATGQAHVCGIAARHRDRAERLAAELGLTDCLCLDDYRRLIEARPDAVLVEVPHEAQRRIVTWALEAGLHVLIGGSLAATVEEASEVVRLARERRLVVEAGYEARYSALWETARQRVAEGRLGRIVMARSIALWAGDPVSWYYDQQASGGMPVTHMTYCFINPVRWLLGRAVAVSAFANRKRETGPRTVHEESCAANILFEDDVLYSATAGFVKPAALPSWSVTLVGTEAALELTPAENGIGTMTAYDKDATATMGFCDASDPFEVQAATFLRAIDGGAMCRNAPDDVQWDVRIAEAIVTSAAEKRTVTL